jgi:hypothetical protein
MLRKKLRTQLQSSLLLISATFMGHANVKAWLNILKREKEAGEKRESLGSASRVTRVKQLCPRTCNHYE